MSHYTYQNIPKKNNGYHWKSNWNDIIPVKVFMGGKFPVRCMY